MIHGSNQLSTFALFPLLPPSPSFLHFHFLPPILFPRSSNSPLALSIIGSSKVTSKGVRSAQTSILAGPTWSAFPDQVLRPWSSRSN